MSGNPTPRVPVAPFIFNNYVTEQNSGVAPDDPIKACLDIYKRFDFDALLRNYFVPDYLTEELISCKNWNVEITDIDLGNGNKDEKTTITTPERQLTQMKSFRRVSANESVEAVTEYFIKEPGDFDQFLKYQPPLGDGDFSNVSHAASLIGDDGLTGPWMHGVFNIVGTYRELSSALEDMYLEEDMFLSMMDYFASRITDYVKMCIKAGADFISFGGNMASGSCVGPKLFETFVMPFEKRVISDVHGVGGKVIYHNCGDMKYLLPLYSGMGIDMLESLTAPPFGDIQLEDAFREISLPTSLSGGIDHIEFLKKATPDEVRERVKDVLDRAKPRGAFILAAGDYFNEGTPEANIRAMAEAGLEYGRY
jgi:hypothetical protein